MSNWNEDLKNNKKKIENVATAAKTAKKVSSLSSSAAASSSAGATAGATASGSSVIFSNPVIIVVLVLLLLIVASFSEIPTNVLSNYDMEETNKYVKTTFTPHYKETQKKYADNVQQYFNNNYECKFENDNVEMPETVDEDGLNFATISNTYEENNVIHACNVKLNYTTNVDDLSKVMLSIISGKNSTISNFDTQQYNEALNNPYVYDTYNNSEIPNYLTGRKLDYEAIIEEQGSVYGSLQSRAFKDDLNDYISTHDVFAISPNNFNHIINNIEGTDKHFYNDEEAELLLDPYANLGEIVINEEEIEVEVCVNGDGEEIPCTGISDNKTTVKKTLITVEANYNVEVYFDLNDYHEEEIDKIAKSIVSPDGSDEGMENYEVIREALDKDTREKTAAYINVFQLNDIAAKVNNYHGFGISNYMVMGSLGFSGVVGMGNFNYGAFATGGIFYSQELWNHVHHITHSLGSGAWDYNCTAFVFAWFYDHYGYGWTHGNGNQVAGNLVAEHPDMFEYGSTPAPGAVISVNPNHVLVCEAWDEETQTLVTSDGNVLSGGFRINHSWRWSDFIRSYNVVAIANPKQ